MKKLYSFVGLSVCMVAIGCGGSGGSGSSPTTVQFSVAWAGRSRAVNGPASALSAKLTMATLTYVVDRHSDPAAYTDNFTTSGKIKAGTYPVTVQFYSQAEGAGDLVGTASATVTIDKTGAGIGTLTTVPTITSVSVTADQTVNVPDKMQLAFTARNAQNQLVAVTPGSATWQENDGADKLTLTADGMATALQAGSANVVATVDGVASTPAAISVPAVPAFVNGGFESPALAVDDWQQASQTGWDGMRARGVANGSTQWGAGGHSSAQYAYIEAGTLSPGQGILSQTVTGLVVGRSYKVTFWIRKRSGADPVNGVDRNIGRPMEVLADSTTILTQTTAPTGDDWVQLTTDTFTATNASTQFMFRPVMPFPAGDGTDLIDDVLLVPVAATPAP